MQTNKDLVELFRMRRKQVTAAYVETVEEKKPKRKTNNSSSQYDIFLKKYENLEKYIDDFSNRDLVYYFKKVAEDSGYKYTISNIQKDMHIFKVLRQNYDVREICGMIEFLYLSEQDYLDKDRLSPNILASRWVNTVYADFKLWLDDAYVPKSKKTHTSKKPKGEWNSDNDSSTTIGLKL